MSTIHDAIPHAYGELHHLHPVHALEQVLRSKGALDITTIPLTGKTDIADYMIVATGTSSRHVSGLSDYVVEALEKEGLQVLSVEGKNAGEWVLIDNATIVVHLFKPEVRERFGLERMWSDSFDEDDEAEEIIGH